MSRAADGAWRADLFLAEDADPVVPALAGLLLAAAMLAACFYRGGSGDEGVALALAAGGLSGASLIALARRWQMQQGWRPCGLDVCVAGAALWMTLQLAWNPAPHAGMVGLVTVGGLCAAYMFGRLMSAAPGAWRVAIATIAVIACVGAAWSAVGRIVSGERGTALFLDINNFAAFLNLSAFSFVAWLIGGRAAGRRVPGLAVALPVCALLACGALWTGSRGALLGLVGGIAVSLWFMRGRLHGRTIVSILGLSVCLLLATAFLFASIDGSGDLASRLAQAGPSVAGQMTGRSEIWTAGWKMLQETPWHGRGLGTWWLVYPPYRLPADPTTGFHAHNDTLEIAFEGGAPLVALLVAGMWLIAHQARRAVREGAAPVAREGAAPVAREAAVLAGALAGLALHSMFNFNLYVAPLPWLVGLVCARLVHLGSPAAAGPVQPTADARGLAAVRGAIVMASAALILASTYVACNAVGGLLYQAGRDAFARGDADGASALFTRAHRWAPWQDTLLIAHADLLFKQAMASGEPVRGPILGAAAMLLERADAANPFKPHARLLRGHLHRLDMQTPGPRRNETAEAEYRRALSIDPYYVEATHALARLWMELGRNAEAAALLASAPIVFRGAPIDMATHLTLRAHAHARAGQKENALAAAQSAGAVRGDGRGAAFVTAFRRTYGL